MNFRTRFAPSPTGPLHLGHAYSAILAHDMAKEHDGTFLLRIEDIDQIRARPAWERQIFDDLKWLGLTWKSEIVRQSDNLQQYRKVLQHLWKNGFLYPCTCKRRDIAEAANAPQEGVPMIGPDGVVYPGTCRQTSPRTGPMPDGIALRLDVRMVSARIDGRLSYKETGTSNAVIDFSNENLCDTIGDIVIARQDMSTSYHLSVVVDDAHQQISHVVRGADLAEATKIHVVLQKALELWTPVYHHHKLIRDDAGKRLAKRDDARAISKFRQDGYAPDSIRKMVGLAG